MPMVQTVREVLDVLGGRFRKEGFVFFAPDGEPLGSDRQRNRVTQRTKAAAKAAGIGDVTFHTLRHTAGSWMAQAGHSQVQIAKVLGHATTATTDRYMHLSPAHLREAVEALEATLHAVDTQVDTTPNEASSTATASKGSVMIPATSAPVGR